MGFLSKLFVILSAALGLFVSGLDLLERFDVDVNSWFRGAPPVVTVVPEAYGEWVDRFAAYGRDAPESPRLQAMDGDRPTEFMTLESRRSIPANPVAMWISGGFAVLMLLILSMAPGRLFRRR